MLSRITLLQLALLAALPVALQPTRFMMLCSGRTKAEATQLRQLRTQQRSL